MRCQAMCSANCEYSLCRLLLSRKTNACRRDCEEFHINEEAAMAIFTRQQRIADLTFGPLTFNLTPFLRTGLLGQPLCSNLKHLTIAIILGSLHDIKSYQHIIEHSRMQGPRIRTTEYYGPDDQEDLLGTEEGFDKFLSMPFSHTTSSPQAGPIQLEKFAPHYSELSQAAHSLPQFIDMSALKHLVVDACYDAAKLFTVLASQFAKKGSRLE